MTNFPASLDTFLNPGAATTMDAAGFEHEVQHANLNDAVAALQAKVGINGSGNTASLDSKIAALNALVLQSNATVKFVVVSGQVLLAVWDAGISQYVPLTCNNGQLGVGAPLA